MDTSASRLASDIRLPGPARGERQPSQPLEAAMARVGVPGISVAAIADGTIAWAEGWGVTEAGGAAVTANTLFQAGSISKAVATLCALHLVAEGTLELDAPIAPRMRSWGGPKDARWAEVTLRHLLTHSSGLTVHGFNGYERGTPVPSVIDVLEGRGNSPAVVFDADPGARYSYAGGGFVIMQQLLEDITDEAFPALAKRLVFAPLGMADSTYENPLPEAQWARAASGHLAGGKLVAGQWHVYPEVAAGGLWTTASDLARFLIAIGEARNGVDGAIVTLELAREMLVQQLPDHPVGLGLQLDDALSPYRGRPNGRFGHAGDTQGFLAYTELSADSGTGAVIMTNSDEASPLIAAVLEALAREQ